MLNFADARNVSIVALCALALAPIPLQASDDDAIESEIESLKREIENKSSESDSLDQRVRAPDAGTVGTSRDAGSRGDEPNQNVPPPEEAAAPTDGADRISAWDLYRDPILCALIAGAVLGLLGVYVVSRRIVFVSAALSQVSALGITLGYLAVAYGGFAGLAGDLLPPIAAVLLAIPVVFLLMWADDTASFPRDAILGTAFVIPMALVLVLGPYIPQEMHEIDSLLHGSAVLVRKGDLYAVAVAGALVVATQLAAFRAFVFVSLDPVVAKTQGLPVRTLDALLFGSIAVMTGLVTRALGALPTFALTVLPAIGALRLTVGLAPVFAVASITGATAGAVGYGLAYAADWSVGASQTLVAAVLMVLLRTIGGLFDDASM